MEPKKKNGCVTVLCIIIIAIASLLIVGILSSDETGDASSGTKAEMADSNITAAEGSAEKVLVDTDKIKATFIKTQDESSLGVFYVFLKIENKTDAEVLISLEDANVDGETIPLITTGVPLVIRPGNSGQTGFIFSMVNLSIDSMEDGDKATFRIVARNNDTMDVLFESELVTIDIN